MEISDYINKNISSEPLKIILKYDLSGNQEDYEVINLVGGACGLNSAIVGRLALEDLARKAIKEGCVYVGETKGNNISWKISEEIIGKPLIKWDFRKYGKGIRKKEN